MSVEYTKKTWYDGSEGGTPITAAELNRVETGIDDVVTQSNADKTNIDTHLAKKVNSSDGAHGLRYYNSELDYYDDTNEEWVEIQTGGGGADVIVPNPQYGSTASKDYSVGDYIYSVRGTLGTDILYVVTTPITRSDTLVVDTNIALSTDEGAEVFVANIVSGESGVPPYNIVGLVNSDGTVTRYGSSKDTSDIANRTLTNIQNTTTTEVEYRYQNTGKTFIADDWAYSNSKYITTETENNVVYALISEDGYTLTSKTATDLTTDTRYIYQNSISGAYFAFVEDAPSTYNIFYSTNLTTWTKVILSGSSGDYAQGNYWFDDMNVAKPISFELNGYTYIVISLAYAQEEQQGTTQDIKTAIIKVRTGTDFVVTNSNLLSFGVGVNTDCFYIDKSALGVVNKIILGTFYSTDGITYTKYTIPNSYEPRFATKINTTTFHIWCADYNDGQLRAYSTTDFSTFTQAYVVPSGTWLEHPEYFSYFNEEASVLLKDDIYFLLGTLADYEHDLFKSAIVSIPTDFDENDRNWCDLPNGVYKFNRHSSKATVYESENGTDYNILNMSPFTSEVGKALAILDVNSGGGSGASSADEVSYDNTTSHLSASNVQDAIDELADGSSSGDYEDLTNLPSINGVELLGNKVIGLLSTNIQVDSDKIGYDNTISGLSANNVKSAIDALKSAIPQNVGKGQSGTGTDSEIFNDYTHNTASGNGSHAEGGINTASGSYSHVEGYGNTASGNASHAGGASCVAATTDSFAHGMGVEVTSQFPASVFAIGKYNNTTPGGSEIFVVGNGSNSNNRSNILEVTDTALDVKGDVKHNGSNLITASTTDLTAGSSSLTTGNIYLVYE